MGFVELEDYENEDGISRVRKAPKKQKQVVQEVENTLKKELAGIEDFDEDDFEAAMAAIEKQASQETPVEPTPEAAPAAPATPAVDDSKPTDEEQQTLDDFSEFL